TISPRAGIAYALDDTHKTVARASYSRFAGQLESGTVGLMNPSSTAGVAVYRWNDVNGDHLASTDEVLLNQLVAAAGGFNPANPWMARVSVAINNAREHYDPQAMYDTNGNPTRTTTEPLVDGGQFAPQSSGNSAGSVFLNAKWQVNANGMYQAPYRLELAASV